MLAKQLFPWTQFGKSGRTFHSRFPFEHLLEPTPSQVALGTNGVISGMGRLSLIDPETYPNGRSARTQDPEGNPIQLWQPDGTDAHRPSGS